MPFKYFQSRRSTAYRLAEKKRMRQCKGFVNVLFSLMKLDLCFPSFSTLSKRLRTLKLTRPFYLLAHSAAQEQL